ncbi:hypothetical protein [Acinetobacter guillouiae]|uniref:phage tail fiber protein n=1 Tax=Acinetobacter guillouiae TaxID=106649 RepID=UPI003D0036CD
MTYQYINLGTAPSGAGGDTFRSTGTKVNENFTNSTHAASRYVGVNAGNVMEVGAFGVGAKVTGFENSNKKDFTGRFFAIGEVDPSDTSNVQSYRMGINIPWVDNSALSQILFGLNQTNQVGFRTWDANNGWAPGGHRLFYHTGNVIKDSNGFLKGASPVIQLFANKIESNEEASEQNPIFEKVGFGHYLIKNTEGFAKEGWWIEVPTDSNGNRICAVEYQTLENGDLEIKTFKKKLNDEGDIVANLDAPVDIPNNANGDPRWIDVRLHSVAKPIVRKVPRTEKQPRMVQQVKYAPQLTYIAKYEDLFDDVGNLVIVDGQKYQKSVTHIQTDKNGTPILSNQPVINDKGEPVFEWVQAIDSEDQPIFDNVPVLDEDGKQIYDEVTYEPQQ